MNFCKCGRLFYAKCTHCNELLCQFHFFGEGTNQELPRALYASHRPDSFLGHLRKLGFEIDASSIMCAPCRLKQADELEEFGTGIDLPDDPFLCHIAQLAIVGGSRRHLLDTSLTDQQICIGWASAAQQKGLEVAEFTVKTLSGYSRLWRGWSFLKTHDHEISTSDTVLVVSIRGMVARNGIEVDIREPQRDRLLPSYLDEMSHLLMSDTPYPTLLTNHLEQLAVA